MDDLRLLGIDFLEILRSMIVLSLLVVCTSQFKLVAISSIGLQCMIKGFTTIMVSNAHLTVVLIIHIHISESLFAP